MDLQQVLGWWQGAVPIPLARVPTLFVPATSFRTDGGEEVEVHKDRTGAYRFLLVRRKGGEEAVRGLPWDADPAPSGAQSPRSGSEM